MRHVTEVCFHTPTLTIAFSQIIFKETGIYTYSLSDGVLDEKIVLLSFLSVKAEATAG